MTKKRSKKETNLVKPSKLPKDSTATVRINSLIKKRLKDDGISIQALVDEAIDKKISKVDYEKKITIETKN